MRELERRRKLWKLEYYSGLEAAKEEGEARGEARGVVRILTTRFGRVPQAVSERVLAIGDLVVLDSLTELAVTCRSLEEFKKALP